MMTEELTPEPLPVQISYERCRKHNFQFISMPREHQGDDLNYSAKCPLVSCAEGVLKPRADD